jgi:hypothetical protein
MRELTVARQRQSEVQRGKNKLAKETSFNPVPFNPTAWVTKRRAADATLKKNMTRWKMGLPRWMCYSKHIRRRALHKPK